MYDLSKAYNTMRTGVVESHFRRFIWRFSEDEEWQDFAIDRVHFGDISAACQLEVSKSKTSDLGKDIDPQAAQKIDEDTYVDDGVTGGKPEDVERMVGIRGSDGKHHGGTISKILALGNFAVKEFVVGGDADQAEENPLGNSVFGYEWDSRKDQMAVKLKINTSEKKISVT